MVFDRQREGNISRHFTARCTAHPTPPPSITKYNGQLYRILPPTSFQLHCNFTLNISLASARFEDFSRLSKPWPRQSWNVRSTLLPADHPHLGFPGPPEGLTSHDDDDALYGYFVTDLAPLRAALACSCSHTRVDLHIKARIT